MSPLHPHTALRAHLTLTHHSLPPSSPLDHWRPRSSPRRDITDPDPNSSFPSAALREVAMPSLSGQPIDFDGGHVGWLPCTEEHARTARPRTEVDGGTASKQPLQAAEERKHGRWWRGRSYNQLPSISTIPLHILPNIDWHFRHLRGGGGKVDDVTESGLLQLVAKA